MNNDLVELRKKKTRILQLIETLNKASKAYYVDNKEIISNYEYDKLYDELVALEKETGIYISGSPTSKVGYEVISELPKETHESPMLSLGKTKNREELKEWLGDKEGLLSWKLDGLTIVLTYDNGELQKAVTRGNGEIGELITNNAKVFKNVPLKIKYSKKLIVRGEAIITYSDFEEINNQIKVAEEKYKNPRNLCSGSVRQLDNRIAEERNIRFYAFNLVSSENVIDEFNNSKENQFLFLRDLGFDTVDYIKVTKDNIIDSVQWFEKEIETYNIPSDGLVLTYDDIKYSKSLGRTAKFPRDSIAFKWADDTQETTLLEIEWSPSKTGLINPVAIFEPVELEGTTVSRASVHNVSILRALKLGIGDTITVYKANMIIPQIAENLTGSDTVEIPKFCPTCGALTEIHKENDAEVLMCSNPHCKSKIIGRLVHFSSKKGIDIKGMSEAAIEFLVNKGWVKTYADLYKLDLYKKEWSKAEGFGLSSVGKMLTAIAESKNTTLNKFLSALSIPLIGESASKDIAKYCNNDVQTFINFMNVHYDFTSMDGFGTEMQKSLSDWWKNNADSFTELIKEFTFEKAEEKNSSVDLGGKTFVITGSLNHFVNRDAAKEAIENHGGKVVGSVSAKTNFLVNNDITSTSGKNKKAKELGIKIITEEELLAMMNN